MTSPDIRPVYVTPPSARMPGGARPQCDALQHPLRCLLRDGYGMLLFVGLLALLCVAVEIGPIGSFLKSIRWGVLAALVIAGLAIRGNSAAQRLTGAHWWLIGLIAIGGMSCSWSIDPVYSVQRWFSFVLLFVAVFVGAWSWLQRRQNLLIGAEILYLLTLVVTLISAFHLGGEDILDRTTRATGAMGKATGAGSFAALTIPIVLWKIRYSRGLSRLFAQFALVVQVYLLFFSGARGALLASSAGLLALMWFNYRTWRPLVLVMGFLMAAFAATGLIGLDLLPDYVVRKESLVSGTTRVQRTSALLVAVGKRPLQGYGFGAGRFVISYDGDTMESFLDGDTTSRFAVALRRAHELKNLVDVQPHNDHIERLVETGLPGAVCFVAMWFCFLARIPGLVRTGGGPTADLSRCLTASMWFCFVDSMLHSGMFAVGNGPTTMTWFCLVMMLASARQVQVERRSTASRDVRTPGTVLVPVHAATAGAAQLTAAGAIR